MSGVIKILEAATPTNYFKFMIHSPGNQSNFDANLINWYWWLLTKYTSLLNAFALWNYTNNWSEDSDYRVVTVINITRFLVWSNLYSNVSMQHYAFWCIIKHLAGQILLTCSSCYEIDFHYFLIYSLLPPSQSLCLSRFLCYFLPLLSVALCICISVS